MTKPFLTPPLKERIDALRAEIDALFDELAAKDAGCGIPIESLKHMLTKGSHCQCRAYLIHTRELR